MSNDERLIEIFLEVAAIEGLSGRERPVADHLIGAARSLGFAIEEQSVEGGDAGNLLVTHDGGGELMLVSHMDTARSTAGLAPQRHDDRLTSDGTTVLGVDNRCGVAILLRTLERVAAGELQACPFSVAFTVREETDLAGSRSLRPGDGIRHAFVLDSALSPGHFIRRAAGARSFRAVVIGRPAHAGLCPEKGVDAIRVASRAIVDLPLGRIDAETTANIGLIEGGASVNTVPGRVRLDGEVRSFDRGKVDEIVGRIGVWFERTAQSAGASVDFQSHWDFVPFTVDLEDSLCRRAVAAIEAAGLAPIPASSTGGSDANSLAARGIPSLNLGIGAQNPHSNEEFVLVEDLCAAARIAAALVSG